MSGEAVHVDYPHHPGTLYDCAACEAECLCDPCASCRQRLSECCSQCVFCALLAERRNAFRPPATDAIAVKVRYRMLRSTVAMHLDGGDLWATNLGWLFAIADVLWHHDPDMIPEEWEYGHAPGCRGDDDSHEDEEIRRMDDGSEAFYAALLRLGHVLTRYDGVLRRAGLSY